MGNGPIREQYTELSAGENNGKLVWGERVKGDRWGRRREAAICTRLHTNHRPLTRKKTIGGATNVVTQKICY